jgi:hypothetical protein
MSFSSSLLLLASLQLLLFLLICTSLESANVAVPTAFDVSSATGISNVSGVSAG